MFRRARRNTSDPAAIHTPSTTGPGASFEVELARSAMVLTVTDGHSILQTIQDAGIDPPFMCRSGICGTCQTTVLSGTIEHHDTYLDDNQHATGKSMTICVSRAPANTRIVLDL